MSILGPSLYRSSIKSQHQQVHLDRPGSQGMGRSGNGPERPDVHGNARHSAWSPELNNFQFLCHEFCFERFKEFLNISRWALREGRGRGWLASCGKTCLKRTLESGAVKSAPPPPTHTHTTSRQGLLSRIFSIRGTTGIERTGPSHLSPRGGLSCGFQKEKISFQKER